VPQCLLPSSPGRWCLHHLLCHEGDPLLREAVGCELTDGCFMVRHTIKRRVRACTACNTWEVRFPAQLLQCCCRVSKLPLPLPSVLFLLLPPLLMTVSATQSCHDAALLL
jgi:hypothetical protein